MPRKNRYAKNRFEWRKQYKRQEDDRHIFRKNSRATNDILKAVEVRPEVELLGELILCPERIEDCMAQVKPEYFSLNLLRGIYCVIVDLYRRKEIINVVTVRDLCLSSKVIEHYAEAMTFLFWLIDFASQTTADVNELAAKLKAKYEAEASNN